MAPELYAKELSLLTEVLPNLRRVGFLVDSANPSGAPAVQAVMATDKTIGIELSVVEIRPFEKLEE